jgi:crotonobetainyl-CoA:carnitine CoA-transferase CaiB-like acyl-CoA transferase
MFLDDIRVMSLAEQYPGPLTTSVLTDFGADVVMVERPVGGDPLRARPTFAGLNRNKRSCCIDLRTDEGREVALRLAAASAVVIEGFRPGVADRLGVGFDAVRLVNPTVLYCSISGYGESGPYARRPGHDLSFQALTSLLSRQDDGTPLIPRPPLTDYVTGLYAAFGIAIGLREVERTGVGTRVDLAMLDAAIAINAPSIAAALNGGEPVTYPPPDPGYGIFRTRCGRWISLGVVGEPHLWAAVCEALDLEWIAQLTLAERVARRTEVIDVLQQRIGELDLDAFERLVGDSDGIYAVVNTVEEAVVDEIVVSRSMFIASTEPGRREIRHPLRFAGHEPTPPRPAPALGLDTDMILAELGLSPEEITGLRARGAVGASEAR